MPSMLGSHGVALATAVVVSGTAIFLAFSNHRISRPPNRPLRSCLASDGKARKKQRVRFADNVKEPSGNGEDYRRQYYQRMSSELDGGSWWTYVSSTGVRLMPAALYTGPDTSVDEDPLMKLIREFSTM